MGRWWNLRIGKVHERWLSDQLGVPANPHHTGIDLLGERVGVESKARMRRHAPRVACHEEQRLVHLAMYPDRELYSAFVHYELSRHPDALPRGSDFASFVVEREAWVLPYDFLLDYPVRNREGIEYRYPHLDDVRSATDYSLISTDGGDLYVPRGSLFDVRKAA